MKRKITSSIIIQLLLFLALIAADQASKYLAVLHLKEKPPYSLISGVLELRYLENRGAAFSLFQNQQWFFYLITAVVLIMVGVLWGRVVRSLKKYALLKEASDSSGESAFRQKTFRNGIFLNYILILLASGAAGNLIDRIRLQYVVDFIYFKLIHFPIFNFADICVSSAAVLLVAFFLFVYKDDKNFAIFGSKKKDTKEH